MNQEAKIYSYNSLDKVTRRIRDDLNSQDLVLLFAYNGTGKTSLSMTFKDQGKKKVDRDTLYFNAFTEDLFYWDNDLESDTDRGLHFNQNSVFFDGFERLELETRVFSFLERYADFNFKINYKNYKITFYKGEEENIKISRGEENIFIWSVFLSICELVIEGNDSYSWVKYIYIDDPISSLDDNNAIAVACDLAGLIKEGLENSEPLKIIISSHHSLFFNILYNEFKNNKKVKKSVYFYHRATKSEIYTLRSTDECPFFNHIALLSQLKEAVEKRELYTYHFNILRSILEKTATFFGYKDFSQCIHNLDDETLYARALNLMSHGKHSIYEPREMVEDTKELFIRIFEGFRKHYDFKLPELTKKAEVND